MKKYQEKGLLKSEKFYFISSIACLAGAVAGLGSVFAAVGLDNYTNASPTAVIATAGIGLAVGTVCSAVGTVLMGEHKKLHDERVARENSEENNYGLDVEM